MSGVNRADTLLSAFLRAAGLNAITGRDLARDGSGRKRPLLAAFAFGRDLASSSGRPGVPSGMDTP
jgi:hypothetical protein